MVKQMIIWVVQHNRGFTRHKFCDLLGLACPNHNVEVAIPTLIKNILLIHITTADAKDIYALPPSVAASINHDASPNRDLVLVAQLTVGWLQIKTNRSKETRRRQPKKGKKGGN